jgi:PAS domain-containing protein
MGETVQKAVELILMRQLAAYLATPILLFDAEGNLLFFNEAAEQFIGRRFADAGELPSTDWIRSMPLYAEDGSPLPPEQRPLLVALRERRPVHSRLRAPAAGGRMRNVASTVIPLEGQSGRLLGGAIIFWGMDAP